MSNVRPLSPGCIGAYGRPPSFTPVNAVACSQGGRTLHLIAAVLHLRGEQLCAQPAEDAHGNILLWNGEVRPPLPSVGCEHVARRPNRPGPHVHMYVRRVAWRLLFRTFSAFRLKSSTLSVPSGSVRFHTYVGPYASTFRAIRTMY